MRILFSILFPLLLFNNSISKTIYSFGATLGGGLTQNKINSKIGESKVLKIPSIMGGLNAEFATNKGIGIRTELNLLRAGYAYNIVFTDLIGNVILSDKLIVGLNYFQIPILLKYSFGNKYKFFANAGPYFGYLLNYSYTGKTINQTFMNSNSRIKSIDFGLSSGVGLVYNSEKKLALQLEIRNNFGFKNIAETNNYL